ncbi:DUF6069 family protein [Thermomonospora catenispora]|uniref:DUF6069 family protein n=1 Tax=Thermomonospora catenispora TaxID=2493090 RepID=UPI00240E57F1|nr:DUF6069 family protein [Thermomonospora catenispora]
MAEAPFGSHSDGGPRSRAHPRGRSRRPFPGACRCTAAARRRPGLRRTSPERYRDLVALHDALSAGPRIRIGRLWAGGATTAACAALITVIGSLIARGLLGLPVPVPVNPASAPVGVAAAYALGAAALTLQATALLQMLMAVAPRPASALAWVCGPITAIATVVPLAVRAPLGAAVATAVINLAAGVVVIFLLAATAAVASRRPGPPSRGP